MSIPATKLLGTWYELIRYRTNNDLPCIYNSQFSFHESLPGTVFVHHRARLNGVHLQKTGIAHFDGEFVQIELSKSERDNFIKQYRDILHHVNQESVLVVAERLPKLRIEKIWECHVKGPKYMIVSDKERKILHVLSQWTNPAEHDYNEIMFYLSQHFDLQRIVQIPHYTSHHYCTKTEFKKYHIDD
jgi:hypothetical protein